MVRSHHMFHAALVLTALCVFAGPLGLPATDANDVNRSTDPTPVVFQTDGLGQAYADAMAARKPLVVMFTHRHEDGTCHHERRQLEEIHSSEFGIDGDEAIFVICCISDPTGGPIDEVAKNLAEQLNVDGYPSISVIEARSDMVNEVAHLNGLFEAERLTGLLRDAFDTISNSDGR